MAAKIIKTLTIAGVLDSFEILEGYPDFGETRERVDVTTLADPRTQTRNHPNVTYNEFTFKVADKGTKPETTAVSVDVTITAKDCEGTELSKRKFKADISKVEPDSIVVGGNRVPVYTVTISPTGEDAAP